jgi:hypothetical protein
MLQTVIGLMLIIFGAALPVCVAMLAMELLQAFRSLERESVFSLFGVKHIWTHVKDGVYAMLSSLIFILGAIWLGKENFPACPRWVFVLFLSIGAAIGMLFVPATVKTQDNGDQG